MSCDCKLSSVLQSSQKISVDVNCDDLNNDDRYIICKITVKPNLAAIK